MDDLGFVYAASHFRPRPDVGFADGACRHLCVYHRRPSNHAIVSLVAAAVIVIIGPLDQAEAIRGIDWDTIGLLAGMMILVSISRRSGLFQYLAILSAQRVRANPAGILLMLQLATAVLSALLNNVSTVLLMVPVTLVIAEELELPPFPFLFAEVFAANIGGTATLIGDPPNILIGTQAGLDFNASSPTSRRRRWW